MTKEDIRKIIIVNIDIIPIPIPIFFTVEEDLTKLGRQAHQKTKSTLKCKFQELENKVNQHIFLTVKAFSSQVYL